MTVIKENVDKICVRWGTETEAEAISERSGEVLTEQLISDCHGAVSQQSAQLLRKQL